MFTGFKVLNALFLRLLGTFVKIFGYGFHFVFPKKRFILPKFSAAPINTKRTQKISRIIWQTNFTNHVTLPVYVNYLCNRLMSLTYEYRFMSSEDRSTFIRSNYSEDIFNVYSRLQIGAAQADFWRVLVLNTHGGVYMDIDANLVWPLEWTLSSLDDDLFLLRKKNRIGNYFIASKSNHEKLKMLIEALVKNIKENTRKNIYDLTGPSVFNEVLNTPNAALNQISYKHLCYQGSFTNKHFQYVDKKDGIWTELQNKIDIVKPN